MGNQEQKTILRESNFTLSKYFQRSRAFTLIEILAVLAIISMVVALAIPTVSRVTYQRLNSTTRTFVGLIRTIRDDTILLNRISRLVIDLDKQTYWVEEQKEFQLLTLAEQTPQESRKKTGKAPPPPPSNFTTAPKYSKKPVEMPSGIVIDSVFKEREGMKISGLVYIHFFPNGFNEQAILHLNKEGQTEGGYSLILHATLGRIDIENGKVKGFNSKPQ